MKIHLCCGAIYLKGYVNCNIDGVMRGDLVFNDNETDLEHYFKDPWEPDPKKRKRRQYIIDMKMDILQPWPWKDQTVDEIVMVSAFEHFEHRDEIPHIINEAHRVLKTNGVFKFDFPDIKKQVQQYYDKDPEFCMELIYCNHKDKHSMHLWGYTLMTIGNYLTPRYWSLENKNVVNHDYPMIGIWATKI